MESLIDIGLVKEQLSLLGHDVADEVILDFVKGLNKGPDTHNNLPSATPAAACGDSAQHVEGGGAPSALRQHTSKGVPAQQHQRASDDAAPSKLQQAPDQQSPKRLPLAAGPLERDSPPPAHSMMTRQRAALDQRCRNFLARCSDKPAPQQQQQQSQHQPDQQPAQLPQRAVHLHVPLLQPAIAGRHHSRNDSGSKLSDAGSSELLLEHDDDDDSESDDTGSQHGGGHAMLAGAQGWPSRRHGLFQQQQHSQHAALLQHAPAELPAAASGHEDSYSSISGSDSEGSDGGGSSVGLCDVAEGSSRFLLHQAATMQRVRARLAAKMAGFTAAAAADAGGGQGGGGNAAGEPDDDDCDGGAAQADSDSGELPRFGFRPGYRPVGIHMPPPPSSAAVDALTAARAMRQQQAAVLAVPGSGSGVGSSSIAGLAAMGQHRSSRPAQAQSLAAAAAKLQQEQQQQSHGGFMPEPLLLPTHAGANGSSSGLHRVLSPGTVAPGAAARSTCSIIGGEAAPGIAAGPSSKARPLVDPLYLAPASPRRSNPATPRSSPAMSPAAMAPLSAAAVGRGLVRSPAAAAVGLAAGRRISSSNGGGSSSGSGARQSLSAGGSRAAQARAGLQQQQQQGGGGRRVSSAPPTPASAAPPASLRAAAGGASGSSTAGFSRRSSSSSNGVSHESLYCQRLAYGGSGSQRNTVAPGVRKTDRVARFQQMQQQWQRDRFLCSGAGGAAAKKAAGGGGGGGGGQL